LTRIKRSYLYYFLKNVQAFDSLPLFSAFKEEERLKTLSKSPAVDLIDCSIKKYLL
jgi:hypothetical protein